jgi:hypothetical protein
MKITRHCESCNNGQERLTATANRDAYYNCLANIGPTWFRDYWDKCLACALLAEAGHAPASYLDLQRKFSLLVAPSAGNPAFNEGHTGDVWSE